MTVDYTQARRTAMQRWELARTQLERAGAVGLSKRLPECALQLLDLDPLTLLDYEQDLYREFLEATLAYLRIDRDDVNECAQFEGVVLTLMSLCSDRLIEMHGNRLQQQGPYKSSYKNKLVRFILAIMIANITIWDHSIQNVQCEIYEENAENYLKDLVNPLMPSR